ncbi:MAG: hypothetical protein IT529_09675 [Burkholderiales bacterium]|nr:hypothetical protein [Burkholderiales bacterium]
MLAFFLLAGCGDPSWREVSAPDGGFTVRMGGDPRVEKRNIDTPAGAITAYWYSLDRKDSVYGVGYADYPVRLVAGTPPGRMFSIVREGWLKRIAGKLDGEDKELKLDGKWHGVEFTARGELDGRKAWMLGRFYLVENRLYQLVVFGNREGIPQADINRFMGSFKVAKPRDASIVTIDAAPDGKK